MKTVLLFSVLLLFFLLCASRSFTCKPGENSSLNDLLPCELLKRNHWNVSTLGISPDLRPWCKNCLKWTCRRATADKNMQKGATSQGFLDFPIRPIWCRDCIFDIIKRCNKEPPKAPLN